MIDTYATVVTFPAVYCYAHVDNTDGNACVESVCMIRHIFQ
jgi:hypothetical protein